MKINYKKYFHFPPGKLISPFFSADDLRVRIRWYINLRWLAIIGVLVAVPIGYMMLHFSIALNELLMIVSGMTILNLIIFFYGVTYR